MALVGNGCVDMSTPPVTWGAYSITVNGEVLQLSIFNVATLSLQIGYLQTAPAPSLYALYIDSAVSPRIPLASIDGFLNEILPILQSMFCVLTTITVKWKGYMKCGCFTGYNLKLYQIRFNEAGSWEKQYPIPVSGFVFVYRSCSQLTTIAGNSMTCLSRKHFDLPKQFYSHNRSLWKPQHNGLCSLR